MLAAGLSLAALVHLDAAFLDEAVFRTPPMAVESAHEQIAAAIALRDVAPAGRQRRRHLPPVRIPYYSGLFAIDFLREVGPPDRRSRSRPLGGGEPGRG